MKQDPEDTTGEKVCNNKRQKRIKHTSFLLSASAERMRGLMRVVGEV